MTLLNTRCPFPIINAPPLLPPPLAHSIQAHLPNAINQNQPPRRTLLSTPHSIDHAQHDRHQEGFSPKETRLETARRSQRRGTDRAGDCVSHAGYAD